MSPTVGERFARALADKDAPAMRALLTDPVDFQALTPGRYWQASSPTEVVDAIILGSWFGPDDDIHELRSTATGRVGDRERVQYRLGVRRNDQEHVVEQQAYYSSDGERIGWLRVLCSGYRPEVAAAQPPPATPPAATR